MGTPELITSLVRDLRIACRRLGRSAWSSVICVAVLALGMAAVTTVFSILNALFFRLPPYPEADRLVAITESLNGQPSGFSVLSWRAARAVQRSATTFEHVALFRERPVVVARTARMVGITEVDSMVFALLGPRLYRGRLLTEDEISSEAPVALISRALWESDFSRDERVIGSVQQFGGRSFTVVGIVDRGFQFFARSDLWTPLSRSLEGRDQSVSLFARLARGASRQRAQVELREIARQLAAADPAYFASRSLVLQPHIVNREFGGPGTVVSGIFFGAALCVLLIACINVANILLARSADAQRRMAISAVLGATRGRLILQSLAESTVLGSTAALFGIVMAEFATKSIVANVPTQGLPGWIVFDVDLHVLVFASVVLVGAVAGFGGRAAILATSFDLSNALRTSGTAGAASPQARSAARRGVVIQFAASVTLCCGAALIAATYRRIVDIDPGYDRDHAIRVYASGATGDSAYSNVAARIGNIAGVRTLATRGELVGFLSSEGGSAAQHRPASFDDGIYRPDFPDRSLSRWTWPRLRNLVVSDSFFTALGLPLLRGRTFEPHDVVSSELVVVVSSRLAQLAWADGHALGRQLQIGKNGPLARVIGVVGNVRIAQASRMGLTYDPIPQVYFTARQAARGASELIVKAKGNIPVIQAEIDRETVAASPQARIITTATLTAFETLDLRFVAVLGAFMSAFAAFGLILSLSGAYGVMVMGIVSRRREFGIRLALGASPGRVQTLVLQEGMVTALIGITIGIGVALLGAPVIRFFVWNISPFNPAVYFGAGGVFVLAAALACYLPSRHVATMEPSEILRLE